MMRRSTVVLCVCVFSLTAYSWWIITRLNFVDTCATLNKLKVYEESTLPKIIHHIRSVDAFSPNEKLFRDEMLLVFPHHEYVLWTNNEMRELIAEHYSWFLETFDGYELDIMRVDAFRSFVLYHYGGLYMDTDVRVVQDFWKYLPDNEPAVVESSYWMGERTQNSLMSSPKHHPFWITVWETLMRRRRHRPLSVLYSTGPYALNDAIERYDGDVVVLPCENFNRLAFDEMKDTETFVQPQVLRSRRSQGWFAPGIKYCGSLKDTKCAMTYHYSFILWTSHPSEFVNTTTT